MKKIKETIRNFLIYLSYFSCIPFLRLFFLKRKYKYLFRALAFHEIKDNQVKDFRHKIDLLEEKFHIISPEDFLNKNFSEKDLNILLTFDDGYESWMENVVPVLKEKNLSTVFFLDKSGFDLAPKLAKMGFMIGSHTLNHSRLPELGEKEMETELKASQRILSEKTGREVNLFAYPFGDKESFSLEVKEKVKSSGYEYGFTILPGFNHKDSDPLLLHRDSINVSWDDPLFLAWIWGAYDVLKNNL
ncbi:MAG: polysaccharide deacetylase family protein [Candidatus Nealsonbacteria bacterium]|nr:polysaccharide deacetylase family protein [Candidatus Nealsonbacteria bacterium]